MDAEKRSRNNRRPRGARGRGRVTLPLALLLFLFLPAAARGEPEFPFNPSLSASASTAKAGESNELSLRLTKPANRCLGPLGDGGRCYYTDEYEEQDFKRLTVTLPAGLAADPNAVHRARIEPNGDPPDPSPSPGLPPECAFALEGFPPAPPPPWAPPDTHVYSAFWECPAESWIGSVYGLAATCVKENNHPEWNWCGVREGMSPEGLPLIGDVYMAEPEPGEQARLVMLVGMYDTYSDPELFYRHQVRVDASVTVSAQGEITTVVDDMPNWMHSVPPAIDLYLPMQAYDLTVTLDGSRGAESGHPLLANPTSCGRKAFAGEAQGYEHNIERDPNNQILPSHGDGKTAPVSAEYRVTGCNDLPYAPTFSLALDDTSPGATPAITANITQAKGEQTTKNVTTTFPKGFQVNFDTKLGQCSTESFEKRECPADSQVGEATADSDLLLEESGPLTGKVFLGPTNFEKGNISLFMDLKNDFLPGGIRLTGNTRIEADGSLVAEFDQVPDLPIKSFELKMFGGKDKGLLLNPKRCGAYNVTAAFTSHQGKIENREAPQRIGCADLSFAVDYGTRRPNGHPTIALSVKGKEEIRSLKLILSRYLRYGSARRLKLGKSYGTLTFEQGGANEEAKVALVRASKNGSRLFSATQAGAQLSGLGVSKPRVKARKGKSKRKAKAKPGELWFGNLKGTNDLTLELQGQTDGLIKNPRGCRYKKGKKKGKPVELNFIADVTDQDGTLHRLSDSVKLACVKKKSSKRR